MSKIKNIIGNVYGRLTVLSFEGISIHGGAIWRCHCECGKIHIVKSMGLLSGKTKSCGCLKLQLLRERTLTHGEAHKTKEWGAWTKLRARCLNPNDSRFYRYGGRGIKFCDRWLIYENFLNDMGRCPTGHSIDRINNDGDYEPGNCRWANNMIQANNKSNNIVINYGGQEMTMKQWCQKLGLNYKAVSARLIRGWSIDRAFNQPFKA